MTKKEFFAYLAGVTDSDGCIMLLKHKDSGCKRGFSWYPRITIANTDRKILEFIEKEIGGHISRGTKNYGNFKSKKIIYQLIFSSNLLRNILDGIIEFLV
ncbi:unnamed protein product, partial [marine sediment metagenome]